MEDWLYVALKIQRVLDVCVYVSSVENMFTNLH